MSEAQRERVLVNVGCGSRQDSGVPPYFDSWHQVRVDIDEAVEPDVIADLTDLSPIPDSSADAVWAAHCIEHLYEHQVGTALAEFRRVLRPEGFLCVIVPDLQTVAHYLVADRLHDTLYESPAGPVTPHDIFFGYGAAIASGRPSMAHRCGFTPTTLQRYFQALPFAETILRRRPAQLELMAVACVTPSPGPAERDALISALEP